MCRTTLWSGSRRSSPRQAVGLVQAIEKWVGTLAMSGARRGTPSATRPRCAEGPAERAQAGEADGHADAVIAGRWSRAAPSPARPAALQVTVRGLAERRPEGPDEVRLRQCAIRASAGMRAGRRTAGPSRRGRGASGGSAARVSRLTAAGRVTSQPSGAIGCRIASVPPSTYRTEPTTSAAASESRKPIGAAISSGRPSLPMAVG